MQPGYQRVLGLSLIKTPSGHGSGLPMKTTAIVDIRVFEIVRFSSARALSAPAPEHAIVDGDDARHHDSGPDSVQQRVAVWAGARGNPWLARDACGFGGDTQSMPTAHGAVDAHRR